MQHVAHTMHQAYIRPLRFVVAKLFPDRNDEWVDAWAHRLFHVVVAAVLLASGIGAWQAAAGGKISLATLEGAMTAVKSREIWEFLSGAMH